MTEKHVTVIGAGLAGCEAAWQIAKRGIAVTLYEMKPQKLTPAHKSPFFSELVCSNSLRSDALTNAVGLLKEEMRRLGSLIMESADKNRVEAGSSLAVDREKFSSYITEKIKTHPLIEVKETEIASLDSLDGSPVVIATGPLTSDVFSNYLKNYLGEESLSFFDASAPIVDASTLDTEKIYALSRYGKGLPSYLNCPMDKAEYERFYTELISAKTAPLHDFDEKEQKINVFEGCMPVEEMAKRGPDTLRFGPLKPVGLPDPKTGRDPYAVVQLRRENNECTMYNLVGFQTHLTFSEQKRVFGLIPGLENAEFLRYGVMHRNTFINSPKLLDCHYSLRKNGRVFFAGQMTGVEGYVESASSGLAAGICAAELITGRKLTDFPQETATGALCRHVSDQSVEAFQPMNVNFGLISPLEKKVRGGKKAKNEALAKRALEYIEKLKQETDFTYTV